MANYEVRVVDVAGLDFNMRFVDCYRGEIVRISTGDVAFRTKDYLDKRTARLQASRLLKNYEYHLAKQGIGFEEQQAQRKQAERLERERKREAANRLRKAAPDLLVALEKCLPVIDAYRRAALGDGDLTAQVVRAAIAKAKGE
jgi:hypothetical protein